MPSILRTYIANAAVFLSVPVVALLLSAGVMVLIGLVAEPKGDLEVWIMVLYLGLGAALGGAVLTLAQWAGPGDGIDDGGEDE